MRQVYLLLSLLTAAVPSVAQFSGAIQGTITDATQAAVPGATVTVTNAATGVTRVVKTSVEGFYRVSNLAPGAYNIRAEKEGVAASRSGYAMWSVRNAPSPGQPGRTRLLVELARDVRTGTAVQTVLVAISRTCDGCQESVPLFRSILETANQSNGRTEVVFVAPERTSDVDFLRSHGIEGAPIRQIDFMRFGIKRIPSIAIIDARDVVSHVWTGVLSGDREKAVLRAVTNISQGNPNQQSRSAK